MKFSSDPSVDFDRLRMNLKAVLVWLCCVTFCRSENLIESSDSDGKSQNSTFVDSSTAKSEVKEIVSYRLPNETIPINYELWLKTDIDKENFNFSGRVKIHVKIIEPTSQITLHMLNTTVDKIDLLDIDKTLIADNLDFAYNEKFEFLIISLPKVMSVNEEMILNIKYHGELHSGIYNGFYGTKYNRENDGKVLYAISNFDSTYARHAFPCYDEPQIRAAIVVEIQHDKSYNAISNMPIISREEIPGTEYVTSKFKETPPISTHLLGFIVSDFKFISNNDTKVEQKIYAKPGLINKDDSQLLLMVSVIGPVLQKIEEHFEVDYPLPKIDHVAIEWKYQSSISMQNNFGLIMVVEHNLFDGPRYGYDTKQTVTEKFVHKLAHQFFGNIVTPKWWTYSWISEGLATVYKYHISSLLFPDEDYTKRFHDEIQVRAMEIDMGGKRGENSRPLNFYVESPKEIAYYFYDLPKDKAAAILRISRKR